MASERCNTGWEGSVRQVRTRLYVLKQRVAPSKAATSEVRAARADFNKRSSWLAFYLFSVAHGRRAQERERKPSFLGIPRLGPSRGSELQPLEGVMHVGREIRRGAPYIYTKGMQQRVITRTPYHYRVVHEIRRQGETMAKGAADGT